MKIKESSKRWCDFNFFFFSVLWTVYVRYTDGSCTLDFSKLIRLIDSVFLCRVYRWLSLLSSVNRIEAIYHHNNNSNPHLNWDWTSKHSIFFFIFTSTNQYIFGSKCHYWCCDLFLNSKYFRIKRLNGWKDI